MKLNILCRLSHDIFCYIIPFIFFSLENNVLVHLKIPETYFYDGRYVLEIYNMLQKDKISNIKTSIRSLT